MKPDERALRVAVVQAAPIIMDLAGSVRKAIALIDEAGRQGANLVVFPEAFLPAYPRGLSFGCVVGSRTMEGRQDWQRYHDNSVVLPGEATEQLGRAAREAGVHLSMGITEKEGVGGNSTLYCTNLFWGPDGALLGKHRKLKPTGSERLIWGEGDGSTLTTVDTPFGRPFWTLGSPDLLGKLYAPGPSGDVCQRGNDLYCADS